MKIYTKSGDKGRTSVIGGRVEKDDPRVEAYGTVDELNSFLGQAICLMEGPLYEDMRADMEMVQHELFDCGGDLAILPPEGVDESIPRPYKLQADKVDNLEACIDKYDAETPDITKFILPGGSPLASALHICRTVCRRAERRVVTLAKEAVINEEALRYLNRLSDLFFTVARTANFREGKSDVEYVRSADVFHTRKDKE
ncbi:cob(I)yrinic acid a,c-diamide adenosyltransferase [Gorillibacterium massiliense]|uniref:cob(I)yrinic acid a,c-diamide adenosyltransferase n=1 Tax=Gorillibacterium massiliense TaxID=1280390 RepID=UPI0004B5633E|nr:cob(I)yrinic acid a,c-diamide adenosyltransferase [Gorillibacterium massiliense]